MSTFYNKNGGLKFQTALHRTLTENTKLCDSLMNEKNDCVAPRFLRAPLTEPSCTLLNLALVQATLPNSTLRHRIKIKWWKWQWFLQTPAPHYARHELTPLHLTTLDSTGKNKKWFRGALKFQSALHSAVVCETILNWTLLDNQSMNDCVALEFLQAPYTLGY